MWYYNSAWKLPKSEVLKYISSYAISKWYVSTDLKWSDPKSIDFKIFSLMIYTNEVILENNKSYN